MVFSSWSDQSKSKFQTESPIHRKQIDFKGFWAGTEWAIGLPMIQTLFKDEELVFKKILNLLASDLEDPETEAEARNLLDSLREHGYDLISFDLEDEECLGHLYLALESAANSLEAPRITH
jgi:hypothetical protein